MINEKRVEELYRMAVYDENDDKKYHQMGEYYMCDYVGKELLKSFFSGTCAFALLVVFVALGNLDGVVSLVNQMNLRNLAVIIIAGYVGFQVIYLMITGVLYAIRYREGHRSLHNYEVHLKRARRMLRRKGKR